MPTQPWHWVAYLVGAIVVLWLIIRVLLPLLGLG
jgi:hypothetical protein